MNNLSFRKTLIAVGVASALGVSAGASALSTESSQTGTHSEPTVVAAVDTTTSQGIQPANTHLSSDLIGANVEQPGDKDQAATLRQLVVDAKGTVTHAILGYGGIVGVGEKEFIVPFSELSITESDGELTVQTSLTAEKVKAMPEFRTQTQASTDAKTDASGTEAAATSKSAGETVSDATESVGEAVGDTVTETQRVTSDSWITTKVKSMIYADDLSQGYEVSVKTLHGEVALTGKLESQAAIDHVKLVAAKVKGVKSVDASAITIQ